MSKTLILSSTSPFRKSLLERLKISFEIASPNIDESVNDFNDPEQVVETLAMKKALKVASNYKNSLIIGCDQLAFYDDKVIGKPGNKDKAIKYLSLLSGKTINFFTGLCLLNTETNKYQKKVERFDVTFKNLKVNQIKRYVELEKPYFCTGGFKSEGLGICLIKEMSGSDPTSLIGLPLISLIEMLENENIEVP
tara:strand:+ start:194 stop:775 length:582 start_codon:yes stop_codon:yes gene_type:complete